MKTLAALALGLWLAAGTVLPVGAQPSLSQGPLDRPCDQSPNTADSQGSDEHAITATIKGVDHQQGILELDTKEGRFVLSATPAEIQGLQEGDLLLVCLEGDDVEGDERLANTLLT
jgi:hypothetical protein